MNSFVNTKFKYTLATAELKKAHTVAGISVHGSGIFIFNNKAILFGL